MSGGKHPGIFCFARKLVSTKRARKRALFVLEVAMYVEKVLSTCIATIYYEDAILLGKWPLHRSWDMLFIKVDTYALEIAWLGMKCPSEPGGINQPLSTAAFI